MNLLATAVHASGGEVGNGGDVVSCEHDNANSFEGFYSLDFMLTLRAGDPLADLVLVPSWEDSVARMLRNLDAKAPDLGVALRAFVAEMANFDDFSRPRIWQEAAYGLVDLQDERIIRRIPANCYKRLSADHVNVLQAVIRLRRPEQIAYQYDREIYDDLRRNDPLQFSFLMVHEWLWDLTDDIEIVRTVDRLLHSTRLDQYSADELKTALRHIGLVPGAHFLSVCERTPGVRQIIVRDLGKPCEQIDSLEGLHTGAMDLMFQSIATLRLGDFSGMNRITSMTLKGNQIRTLFESQFEGMVRLGVLGVNRNLVTALPRDLFAPIPQVGEVNFSDNRLTSLAGGLFRNNHDLTVVDFSRNLLSAVPPDLLSGIILKTIGSLAVDLRQNHLTTLPQGFLDGISCPAGGSGYPCRFSLLLAGNAFSAEERLVIRRTCSELQERFIECIVDQ